MHMLTNISGSKGNQTMNFGQLIQYNLTNIFLEKSYTKCGGESIPRPIIKKSKLSIPLDQCSKVIYFVFIVWQVKAYRNWLKLSCRPPVYTSNKTFFKKKRSESSLPASYMILKKNISLVIFFYVTKFQCLVSLTCEILGNCNVYYNFLLTGLWRNKFWD